MPQSPETSHDPRTGLDRPPSGNGGPDLLHFAAGLLIAALLITGLYVGRDVLIPLAVAVLISFALSPLVSWLVRIGVQRVIAVIMVLLTVFLLLGGLGVLLGSQLRGLAQELPTYQETIREKVSNLSQQMRGPGILDGAMRTVDTLQKEVDQAVENEEEPLPKVQVVPPPVSPFETAVAWLTPALEPLATAGIVIVFVFLILLDNSDLRDRLLRILGGNLHRATDALEEAGSRISRYLLMQLLVNVSYGIPMALGLWLIGVPGWILWGSLAAVMRFIPYVGPMLSAIFPLSLAFAVDPSWEMVLWTLALILLLELISNNIIEPLLYGTSTGLSALSLIAAATFWTALWGPVGLILSTPLTVCLLVLGRNLPQLSFLETILGSAPALDPPTRIYQRLLADDADEAIAISSAEIEATSVTEFYNDTGIEVLRRVSQDFSLYARAEHRLRVANGMDLMLDDLREDYPPPAPPTGKPLVAAVGGRWEIDAVACEMLAHALAFDGILAEQRPAGVVTSRYVEKLNLDSVEIILLSYFSSDPAGTARNFCRRLRHRWPGVRIVLALWNVPPTVLEDLKAEDLGADEIVTSMTEARLRIARMLDKGEVPEIRTAQAPEDDSERVTALRETMVLQGHMREELDALAKRAADVFDVPFAVISAIDEEQEYIVGQSMELPGRRTGDGTDMITMPRSDAICDHVVSAGEALVVPDTDRDPRFSDHPAIRLWNTRFYAGVPVQTPDGHVLGALCLLDTSPRKLTEDEIELLGELAADVASAITGEETEAPELRGRAENGSMTLGQRVPD